MSLLISRGLTGNAASIISRGFFSSAVKAVIKGGRRFVEKAYAEFEDHLKISVNLISMNGKELTKPIFNKVSKAFKTSNIMISVFPKTLTVRKPKKIKVTAKLRKEDNEQDRFTT